MVESLMQHQTVINIYDVQCIVDVIDDNINEL